jgi:hypothetical protein
LHSVPVLESENGGGSGAFCSATGTIKGSSYHERFARSAFRAAERDGGTAPLLAKAVQGFLVLVLGFSVVMEALPTTLSVVMEALSTNLSH